MDWTAPIDGYCERTDPSFWAEPLNAVSNLAFILAAIAAFAYWRRMSGSRGKQAVDAASIALVGLVAIIGIGSFLFHTFANRWSSLADVLPIAVFIYGYFGLALYRYLGFGRIAAIVGTLLFLGFSFFADDLFGWLVGSSAGYVPALLSLLAIGGVMVSGRLPAVSGEGRLVLAAGGVFTLSLALRIADGPVCDQLPMGTHFLWHVLNATTLGLLLVAAIRRGPQRPKRRITA